MKKSGASKIWNFGQLANNLKKILLTAICQSTILTTNNFQKGRCYGKTYSRHNIHGHYNIREYDSGVCF